MKDLLSRINTEFAYSIGIRKREDRLLFEGNNAPFTVIPVTSRVWYADPIVFCRDGVDYLFCEAYDRETDLGYVAVTELDSLHPTLPRKVLDVGKHLSYPCVFEQGGQVYMIPETTTQKNIQLFRAKRFPDEWEFITELKNGGEYADSTVYEDAEKMLVLTFEQYPENGSITKVHVYDGSQMLSGKLLSYPSQPFTFSRTSRGGGKLFWHNGKLLRPAQDCTVDYGYGLHFLNVAFTDGEYREEACASVYPEQIKTNIDKKVLGVHTYALTDNYEIIDIKFNDPVFRHQLKRILGFVSRKLRRQ